MMAMHGDRVMTPVNMIWIELEKVNKDKQETEGQYTEGGRIQNQTFRLSSASFDVL